MGWLLVDGELRRKKFVGGETSIEVGWLLDSLFLGEETGLVGVAAEGPILDGEVGAEGSAYCLLVGEVIIGTFPTRIGVGLWLGEGDLVLFDMRKGKLHSSKIAMTTYQNATTSTVKALYIPYS